MHPAPLQTAAEYIDRELTLARSRRQAIAAGERLCQLLELLDFTEFHHLHGDSSPCGNSIRSWE